METIQAQVSTRLLSKASRLFTGTLKDWKKIIFDEDETLTILYKDGTEKVYKSSFSGPAAT